jgi:hypothetical protein
MTDFDRQPFHDRLVLITANRPSTLGDLAYELIGHLAETHADIDELEAQADAQDKTIALLRGGIDPRPAAAPEPNRWRRTIATVASWFRKPLNDPDDDDLDDYMAFADGTPVEPLSRREKHLQDVANGLCDEIDNRNVLLAAVLPHIDREVESDLYGRVLEAIAHSEIGAQQ